VIRFPIEYFLDLRREKLNALERIMVIILFWIATSNIVYQ
jgi:hypothetical protein